METWPGHVPACALLPGWQLPAESEPTLGVVHHVQLLTVEAHVEQDEPLRGAGRQAGRQFGWQRWRAHSGRDSDVLRCPLFSLFLRLPAGLRLSR